MIRLPMVSESREESVQSTELESEQPKAPEPNVQQMDVPEFATPDPLPPAEPLSTAVSTSPYAAPVNVARERTTRATPPRREYKMLKLVALLYKIAAGMVVAGWLFITTFMLLALLGIAAEDAQAGAGAAIVGVIPWLIQTMAMVPAIITLLAMSQLVELAMDVQSNTYDAAYR